MCGLIAFISKNKKGLTAGERILNQYQDQHRRGKEGFGLTEVFANKKYKIQRATEPVKALMDVRFSPAPIQIFHHRMPTSTENALDQTHPFFISHPELKSDWLINHNGVIRNDDELFEKHTKLKYKYLTSYNTVSYSNVTTTKFNDSESLAIELARYFEGKTKILDVLGTVAFIAIRLNKKSGESEEMLWGRNELNPLEILETKDGLLIASTINNSNAEIITPNTFESINLLSYFKNKTAKKITKQIKTGILEFKKIPPPVISTYNKQLVIPKAQNVLPRKTNLLEDKDWERYYDDAEYEPPMSKRDKAFEQMANRVIDDISDDITDFFVELAYDKINENQITSLANKLHGLLLERSEVADSKVRPFFDNQEEQEDALNYAKDKSLEDKISQTEEDIKTLMHEQLSH